MATVADRVKETTTTTGTGTYTLAGAQTGFRTFAAAFSNLDTVEYAVSNGVDWEVGRGVFTLSGTTLSRAVISASSNGGLAVSWGAGPKDIWSNASVHFLTTNTYLLASSDFANQGTTTTVLHGNAAGNPAFGKIIEADLLLTDLTTFDVDTNRHGFVPKADGIATHFLNGQSQFVDASTGNAVGFINQSFTGQTSVNVAHNFGGYPEVQVLDASNVVMVPLNITHNTTNDFTVTFSISTTGKILATIGSFGSTGFVTKSVDYTITASDYIVKAVAGGLTFTLETAVGCASRRHVLDNGSGGLLSVIMTGGQTLEGQVLQQVAPDNALDVYSDGVNWRIS